MATSKTAVAEGLARDFLSRVWGPQHDVDAIDELMTADYVLHSGGNTIRGREAFKGWIAEFQRAMPEFHGISVYRVRDGRLSECWVEREAPKVQAGSRPE
jgi:hypothetical protein